MEIITKKRRSAFNDAYVDVRVEGRSLTLTLGSTPLKTDRGVYSLFVEPSVKCAGDLTSESPQHVELKARLGSGTLYKDIALDLDRDDHHTIYLHLQEVANRLKADLVRSISVYVESHRDTPLARYVQRYCPDSLEEDINIMFLKQHSERPGLWYLHLKVTPTTESSTACGGAVDLSYLMYKTHYTCPVLKVDNIRVPRTRDANNRLNVHLAIVREIVSV